MIAKLLLDTKDFANKIGKATKDVEGFGKKGELTTDSLMKGFGKVVAAVGAAVASYATFNKAIESSQALTDAWGRSMQAVNTVFDNFVYGLANADFSSFSAGMDSMIQKAREMYDAYDQLANTLMSARFTTALKQSEFKEVMTKARDKKLPVEERRAALEEATVIVSRIDEAARRVIEDSERALAAKLAASSGVNASYFSPGYLEEAFYLDSSFGYKAGRKNIEKQYEQYTSELNAYIKDEAARLYKKNIVVGADPTAMMNMAIEEAGKSSGANAIRAKHAKTIAQYEALFKAKDEELEGMIGTYINALQQRNVSSEMNTSINELSTTIGNEVKATSKAIAQAGAKARADALAVAAAQAAVYDDPHKYATPGMMRTSFDNSHFWLGAFVGRNPATRYKSAVTEDYKSTEPLPKSVESLPDVSFIEKAAEATRDVATEAPVYADGVGMASEALSVLSTVCGNLSSVADDSATKILKIGTALLNTIAMIMNASSPIGVFGAIAGFATSVIPQFADGGVVTRPTVGLVGEAGNEAIIPLNRLNEFIGGREVKVTGRLVGSGKDLTAVIDNYNRVKQG